MLLNGLISSEQVKCVNHYYNAFFVVTYLKRHTRCYDSGWRLFCFHHGSKTLNVIWGTSQRSDRPSYLLPTCFFAPYFPHSDSCNFCSTGSQHCWMISCKMHWPFPPKNYHLGCRDRLTFVLFSSALLFLSYSLQQALKCQYNISPTHTHPTVTLKLCSHMLDIF